MELIMERTRNRFGVYRGVLSLCLELQIEQRNKNERLYRPPFDILHVTTNLKHAVMTEGGWDKTCHRAGNYRGVIPLFWAC
jgi:hypothetical protein